MALDTMAYPYDTVVYITDVIGGQTWQGSGVLISPDEVLTASHVVYNSIYGSATDITVSPGYNAGSEPFGGASGTYIHYFQIQDANDFISNQQSQYDYAVIHLSHPFTSLGTMGIESNYSGGYVNVTGYPGILYGQMENSQQYVFQDPFYTLFDGTSLGSGSSGGPVWISDSSGQPYVVGLVSSAIGGPGSTGYFVQITTSVFDQIQAWVAQDDAAAIAVLDTSRNQTVSATGQAYTGPVSGLLDEYIDITGDNLNVSVTSGNWFIHTGSGNDAIAAFAGTNVLDGGTGSNFLSGGSGADTFFVDDRAAAADIWSTVTGFHTGDAATIWGVTPQDFALNWADGQGAAGYTGLTLHASATGKPTASLTLAGYSQADLTNGRLSVTFGTDTASGSPYMYIHGNA